MQDIRGNNGGMTGSLRTSKQKKTIRKTNSPSQGGGGGGVCFSIFKCCNQPDESQDVESRIVKKNKNGKKVQMDANPEVIDVSEANKLRLANE